MIKVSIRNLILLVLMLAFAGLAAALRPTISLADERPPIDLKAMVPAAFGDWRLVERNAAYIVDPQTQQKLDKIYSETLSRTYVNSKGYQIMLSIAYGKNQSDALQLHKPEVCYPAQGFQLTAKQPDSLVVTGRLLPVTRLVTKLNLRLEPVTYWTTIGDYVITSSINKKLTEMRYALNNRVPDGMLVRVSSIDGDTESAYKYQDQFAQQLLTIIAPHHRLRFAGATRFGNAIPQRQ